MGSLIEYLRNQRKKEVTMENTENQVKLNEELLTQALEPFSTKLEEFNSKLAGKADEGATASKIENLEQRVAKLEGDKTEQAQPDFRERFEAGELTAEDKKWLDNVIVPDVLTKFQEATVVEGAQETVSPEPQDTTSPDFDPAKPYIEFHDESFEGAEYNEAKKRYEKLVIPS